MTDQELLDTYARIFDDPVDGFRRPDILRDCRAVVEAPTHAAAVAAVSGRWGCTADDVGLWGDVAEFRRAAGVSTPPDQATTVQTVQRLVESVRAGRMSFAVFVQKVREAVGA